MKNGYNHEEFTCDMFERVNANHHEAIERKVRKAARAEWKRLLHKRAIGGIRAFGALGGSTFVTPTYTHTHTHTHTHTDTHTQRKPCQNPWGWSVSSGHRAANTEAGDG